MPAVHLAEPRLLWLCLLAPALAIAAGVLWRRRLAAAATWASRGLWQRLLPGYRPARLGAVVTLLALAVLGTALALAQPRWGMSEEKVERRGVDVVLVLDSSLSMSAQDVAPDRLTVAKLLCRQLVTQLAGHRLALVQSEGEGEVLAPLTLDRGVIDLLVDSVTPASLPTPGTRLSHGIARAVALFPTDRRARRVIVVLSDGEDHGEDWETLVRQLDGSDIIVHTIGVGTPQGGLLPLPGDPAGNGYKLDDDGHPVVSRLQPELLRRLSQTSGGRYVEATQAGVSVAAIAEDVGKLEARSLGSEMVRQEQERFPWFLGAAIAALTLALALSPFRPREMAS